LIYCYYIRKNFNKRNGKEKGGGGGERGSTNGGPELLEGLKSLLGVVETIYHLHHIPYHRNILLLKGKRMKEEEEEEEEEEGRKEEGKAGGRGSSWQ